MIFLDCLFFGGRKAENLILLEARVASTSAWQSSARKKNAAHLPNLFVSILVISAEIKMGQVTKTKKGSFFDDACLWQCCMLEISGL